MKYRIENSDFCDYVLDHICSGCGRYYKYRSTLKRHQKYECGARKNFEYGVCGKQFAWREYNRSISYEDEVLKYVYFLFTIALVVSLVLFLISNMRSFLINKNFHKILYVSK